MITANGVANTGTLANALTVQIVGDAGALTDYTVSNVTLAAGTASGTTAVPIGITDDALPEATENFTISLGTVTGGGSANVTASAGTLGLTITDNDGATGTVAFSNAT